MNVQNQDEKTPIKKNSKWRRNTYTLTIKERIGKKSLRWKNTFQNDEIKQDSFGKTATTSKKKTKKRKIFYDEIKQDSFGKTCHWLFYLFKKLLFTMENATAADSSQSNISRIYIWKEKTVITTSMKKIWTNSKDNHKNSKN